MAETEHVLTVPSPTDVQSARGDDVTRAHQILEQVERGEITDEKTAGMMADLGVMAGVIVKRSEEARTRLVKPLNDHVKWINQQFKEAQEPASKAKTLATRKVGAWQRAEAERVRKEQEARERAEAERKAAEERERKAREDEALAKAEAAAAAGDTEQAEALLEEATSKPEPEPEAPPPAEAPTTGPVRGSYGGVGVGKRIWTGTVVSNREFFLALANGELDPAAFVDIKASALKAFARELRDAMGPKQANGVVKHGIRVTEELETSLR